MQIIINVPLRADIISGGCEVSVAREGESWQGDQLGDYANKRGIYIHQTNGRILYIGTATGLFVRMLHGVVDYQLIPLSNDAPTSPCYSAGLSKS